MSQSPYADTDRLIADSRIAALDAILRADASRHGGLPTTPEQFAALRERVRASLRMHATAFTAAVDTLREVGSLRSAIDGCRLNLPTMSPTSGQPAAQRIRFGHCARSPQQLPRYLRAARPVSRLSAAGRRGTTRACQIDRVVGHWNSVADSVSVDARDELNEQAGWIVEELRVGLFAQRLGTAYPISEKPAPCYRSAICASRPQ